MVYKCYTIGSGVMGWIEWENKYMMFADETDYREYLEAYES